MALGHGVRRLRGGRVRVRLSERERVALRSLPDQLRALMGGEGGPGAVRERLFPRAYDDADREREYRELVGEGLVAERVDALETFARTLDGGETGRLVWTVELSAEETGAWLSAVNDARLALGVLLGVETEAQWESGPEHGNAASAMLWYLGWLQEELVAALAGDLA